MNTPNFIIVVSVALLATDLIYHQVVNPRDVYAEQIEMTGKFQEEIEEQILGGIIGQGLGRGQYEIEIQDEGQDEGQDQSGFSQKRQVFYCTIILNMDSKFFILKTGHL